MSLFTLPGRVHRQPAIQIKSHFPHRRLRSRQLRELLATQAGSFYQTFINEKLEVLWERSIRQDQGWLSSGLSDNYIKITAYTQGKRANCIDRVIIRDIENGHLLGEVVENEK